jgi:hypothetical protein
MGVGLAALCGLIGAFVQAAGPIIIAILLTHTPVVGGQISSPTSTTTSTDTVTSTNTPIVTLTPSVTLLPTSTATSNPVYSLTPTFTDTAHPVIITATPIRTLIYEENFESGVAKDWLVNFGAFIVKDDGRGNKVWKGGGGSQAFLAPSISWKYYAIEIHFAVIDWGSNILGNGVAIRIHSPRQGNSCSVGHYSLWLSKTYGMSMFRNPPGRNCNPDITLGQTSRSAQVGRWHTVYIEVAGSTLRWRMDDGILYEASDNTYDGGGIGIDNGPGEIEVWYDSIRAWSLR